MIITFTNKKLKKYANNHKLAIQKLGAKRAEIFQKRLDDLATAESFADLEFLPGRYHQLKENRKDQWSCDLDHPYRLIFIPSENPIPKNDSGVQILIEIKSAEIIEIEDTHQ
ncbi:MAG: type II toxin-antitoxin system RelE/ParE family toxin [Labilibaculum sp.]|nr:type II toxin-antitoxin system RelE/ParE family toxin [Labilibaculum sp.]MBI9060263.1 type II toxin-antitoxin system RelE/ParE family toxin [Labilibaculum sp.]